MFQAFFSIEFLFFNDSVNSSSSAVNRLYCNSNDDSIILLIWPNPFVSYPCRMCEPNLFVNEFVSGEF